MTAKLQVSIGDVTFSGEGPEQWLEKQFDKLLKATSDGESGGTPARARAAKPANAPTAVPVGALPIFLSAKKTSDSEVKRFLATAEWLHLGGKARLTTPDVTQAVSNASLKRFGNASECLNKNVAKGHCQKEAKQFYVTPEGRATLV